MSWYANWQVNPGACGIAVACSAMVDPKLGYLRHNAVAFTGQNPHDAPELYCTQAPLAVHSAPEGYNIEDNWLTCNHRAPADLPNQDLDPGSFQRAIRPLVDRLSNRHALQASLFLEAWATDGVSQ